MDNEELLERKRIARHEALHGLLGLRAGAEIQEIEVWPVGGTLLRFPLNPWTLKYHYGRSPAKVQEQVTKILASLLGPTVASSETLQDEDLRLVTQWQQAWSALPGERISANELHVDARFSVLVWLKPNRQWIDKVTLALVQRQKVWGHAAWLRLVQQCRPPQAQRRISSVPSRPAAPRQRALSNAASRSESVPWSYHDGRTSRRAGAPVHLQVWRQGLEGALCGPW